MPNFILKLNSTQDTVYQSENIICYLLDTKLGSDFIKSFDAQGKMVLLQGKEAAPLCKSLDTSGMVLELDTGLPIKAQVIQIRETIGAQKVFGAIIPPRRHEAMLISETEPEFVAFKFSVYEQAKAAELIAWYNELFLIQSAVDLSDGLQEFSNLDTDFVIINSSDYKDFGC